MPEIIRAQVTLHHVTALPENAVVNTFYFNVDGPLLAAADSIEVAMVNFYSTVNDGFLGSIASYLSNCLTGEATVKLYNMGDAEPRVPIDEYDFSFTIPDQTPLPSEVAVVLSFEGAKISGLPQARRRGRVFLGPLNSTAMIETGAQSKVAPAFIQIIRAAAERLMSDSGDNDTNWSVYSPTTGGAVTVVDGWIDNAFDIIRKRGERPTVRETWPV